LKKYLLLFIILLLILFAVERLQAQIIIGNSHITIGDSQTLTIYAGQEYEVFNVTDNGGEAFRVTDGGGQDFNVKL
jgi:hypothetical protein